jgi:hypothetical protein
MHLRGHKAGFEFCAAVDVIQQLSLFGWRQRILSLQLEAEDAPEAAAGVLYLCLESIQHV